jgi:hypothetical protein
MMQHDGSVPGFSAIVGLLPKSDLGFVFLTNSQFLLPATAVQLVPQYLLGELPPAPSRTIDLRPYVGRYVANFATFSNETFTVSERNRRLWIDIPSRLESALNPPRADGRWSLVRSEQPEVSFDRDKSGRVVGLKLHEGGAEFEVPREGVVIAPEIPLDELRKYVSRYRDVAGSLELELFIQNQRLAVRLPNDATMDLRPPDATGRRVARANNGIALVFEESPAGAVTGVNFHRPGAVPVMRMTPVLDTLPSVAEIIALRRIPTATASSAPFSTMRTTGRIRFAQSGVDGRFTLMTAGDSRSRTELDLGRFGQNQIVMNNGRLWRAVTGDSVSEIGGKQLKQIRLSHPSVLFGDWRKYYDSVRVVRAGQLEGRKLYGIQLESAGLPPTRVAVDAETGDVLQEQRTMVLAGVGAIASTTTYSDYRDVGGMRVSHRYVETNEQIGRTIYEVERVEVGVELGPDTFRAPTAKSDGERRR